MFTSRANVLLVDNGNQYGAGTLDSCFLNYNSGDTIYFSSDLEGDTIIIDGNYSLDKSLVLISKTNSPIVLTKGIGRIGSLVSGDFLLKNITFYKFFSFQEGAVLRTYLNSNVVFEDCNFIESESSAQGGALFIRGVATFKNCLFESNSSLYEGGAVYLYDYEKVKFVTTTFKGNSSSFGQGGAVFGHGNNEFVNCTFSENGALTGGALFFESFKFETSVSLTNCTFSENVTESSGQGIYVSLQDNVQYFNLNLKNCILDCEETKAFFAKYSSAVGTVQFNRSYTLLSDASISETGEGNLNNANAKLGLYGNYGGGVYLYNLLSGSPAINNGTTEGAPFTDQRGYYRTGNVDIGAFEYNGVDPTLCAQVKTIGQVKTCSNIDYQLEIQEINNFNSIQWYTLGDGQFDDVNSLSPVYSSGDLDADLGVVPVVVVADNGASVCPTISDTINIVVQKEPMVYAGEDVYVCETDPYNWDFINPSVENVETFIWSTLGDGFINGPTNIEPNYTMGPNDVNNREVRMVLYGEGQGICADKTDTMMVKISSLPEYTISDPRNICENESVSLSFTGQLYNSVGWETLNDGSFDAPSSENVLYNPGDAEKIIGTYEYKVIIEGSVGCEGVFLTEYFDGEVEQNPILVMPSDETLCASENNAHILANISSGYLMNWGTTGDGTFDDATTTTPLYTFSNNDANKNEIEIFVNVSPLYCAPISDTVTFTFDALPSINTGGDLKACSGSEFTLSNVSANSYESIVWQGNGSLGSLEDSLVLNPIFNVKSGITTGSQVLNVNVYGSGECSSEIVQGNILLELISQPTNYAGEDEALCINSGSISLDDSWANDYAYVEWISDGDGSFLDASVTQTNYVLGTTDLNENNIELTLIAHGYEGCDDAISTKIINLSGFPSVSTAPSTIECSKDTAIQLEGVLTKGQFPIWVGGTGVYHSNGETALYTPTQDEINAGQVLLVFSASGTGMCSHINTSKSTVVTFTNDCVGNGEEGGNTGTSLSQISSEDIHVYPNPAIQNIFIDIDVTGSFTAELFDMSGKLLLSQNLENNEVDVQQFVSGIYILKIEGENQSYTTKVFKK